MPFKSKAQRRKFAELLVAGKITEEAYERWNRETGSKVLVERVHPKTASRRRTVRKPARRRRVRRSRRRVA